jgi:hypothetical protein
VKQEKLAQFHWEHHWDFFAEFCYYEMAAGGPDPHMVLTGHLARHQTWEELVWRGLCYLTVYNVPTAERIWQDWPWPKIILRNGIGDWVEEHWVGGITTRRERRSVRQIPNMIRCLEGCAWWLVDLPEEPWMAPDYKTPEERYWEAYKSVLSIPFYGRYNGMKFVEYGMRYAGFPLELPGIHPRGGWSPRSTLALLFPKHIDALMGDDRDEHLIIADRLADRAIQVMRQDYGIEKMDRYLMQVLLCDYKQSFFKRQFPGRSLDSTLHYAAKIGPYWGGLPDTEIWQGRKEIFPNEHLGELNGWNEVREDLPDVLRDHGYTWSDLVYDYSNTKDLAQPVRWETPAIEPLFEGYERMVFDDSARDNP